MKINPYLASLLLGYILFLQASPAHAVISCSVSSPGWVSSYSTTTATNTTGSASATISCTRASADPTTQTYTLSADNGLTPKGGVNQAISGASKLQYNEFQDAANTILWGPSPPAKNAFTGTLNFGTGTSASAFIPFYFSMTALQAVAAGNYTDTVTMTLTYSTSIASATHSVLIIVDPVCTISTPPGNLTFAYTSFQPGPSSSSTSFSINCTLSVPYTASLDAYAATDTATSIIYALNLGQSILPTGSTYSPGAPLSAVGSGMAQTISIDGAIAPGQAGTCAAASCSGTTTRTLTITY